MYYYFYGVNILPFSHGCLSSAFDRYESYNTNLGRLMEAHGPRLLGKSYQDPITSFSTFHNFTVKNPEVCAFANRYHYQHYGL